MLVRPGRRTARCLRFETLDARLTLCAEHMLAGVAAADGWIEPGSANGVPLPPDWVAPSPVASDEFPAGAPTAPNGLPLLDSRPGAPVAVYLDFDGHGSNLPYDIDGNTAVFGAQEQANITEGWKRLAAHFAPFDVNVTTVVPTVPYSWSVISNSITGVGFSYLVFNGSSPGSYNPSGDIIGRTSGVLHEIGHNFGLQHQSEYDLLGNKTKEYRNALDNLHAPIMGVDYDGSVQKWYIGRPSNSVDTLQDDIARIVTKIIPRQPAGGDGFRADDFGSTIATAASLTINGSAQTAAGIIERLTDQDVFAFTSNGGMVTINATRESMSSLDMRLEIRNAAGVLLANADSDQTNQQLAVTLPAGTYYAIVASHGDYSDIGPYNLSVVSATLPTGWGAQDIGSVGLAGTSNFNGGTSTFTIDGSGSNIEGTSDAFQFAYRTLTGDGSITARITAVEDTAASAKAGVMIRETLAPTSKHAFMLATPTNGSWLRSRSSTGGTSADSTRVTETFSPIWVRLTRSGTTLTGFTSTNGVDWVQEGTAIISMGSTVNIGLAVTSTSNSELNTSTFTDVTFTGTIGPNAPVVNALPAPTALAVTGTTAASIALSWNAVAGATGYTVERSSDGETYATAGTTAAGVTTFNDTGRTQFQTYFYRVRANDATGVSVPSSIVNGRTRPGTATNLTVTSLSTSRLVLNWRDTSGDTGYRVERSTNNVDFTPIGTVGTNVPGYTDTGLTAGTQYYYRLVTLDAAGGGSTTSVVNSNTRLATPGAITLSAIQTNSITLSWADINGESSYTIERSTDGENYTSLTTLPAGTTTYADTTVTPVNEYYYRLVGVLNSIPSSPSPVAFAATPTAVALPSPWTRQDIGTAPVVSSVGHDNGTFKLISAGAGITGTSDSFTFVHQPLVGDGTIIARVATGEPTADNAKIGLMIRESLAANAREFSIALEQDGDAKMSYRTSNGGGTTAISATNSTAPIWLRIDRAGNSFRAFRSVDGNAWTQVGGTIAIAMPGSAFVGLVSTSDIASKLNTSTVDNISIGLPLPLAAPDSYQLPEDGGLTTGVPSVVAIAAGSSWRYLDDASNQGTAWREFAFNDSAWAGGGAPLGHGDSGIVTPTDDLDDSGARIITTYFRQSFALSDVQNITRLSIELMRDDGAAVYLNGVEIVRSNLAANPTFSTLATASVGGADETTFFPFQIDVATLPTGTLREGNNVIAVEVHQQSETSGDLRFDMKLEAIRSTPAGVLVNDRLLGGPTATVEIVTQPAHGTASFAPDTTLTYTPTANYFGNDSLAYRVVGPVSPIIYNSSTWKYLDNGSNQGTAWTAKTFVDTAWASGPGELGYGDGDEGTVVDCSDVANCNTANFVTTYFRKHLTLPAGTSLRDVQFLLLRDDAAAVYVNGTQVFRDTNLPANAAYDTLSTGAATEDIESTFNVDASLFVPGDNVIAVEVHQQSRTSTDVSFNLEMTGRYVSAPATVALTITPSPDLPSAVADAYQTNQNQALSSAAPGVLANDNNPDQEALTAIVQGLPTHGILSLLASGAFTYLPSTGYVGPDSFRYNITDGSTVALVPRGAIWKYYDQAAAPPATWSARLFSDGGWAAGPAELGYGDDDEATTINCGTDPECDANNIITAYFRHTFNLTDRRTVDQLSMTLRRDDAAAVYVNGVQVFRDTTLPAGAGHTTPATGTAAENLESTFIVPASVLVDGANVIAVEVHQQSASSTDLSFDLSLSARQLSNVVTVDLTVVSTGRPGDFNHDELINAGDIDLLFGAILGGSPAASFDLTGDLVVDQADVDRLVQVLVDRTGGQGTRYGDANLDGVVDRSDVAIVMSNFGYAGVPAWSRGDFNGSGGVTLADLTKQQANLGLPVPVPSPSASPVVAEAASASQATTTLSARKVAVTQTAAVDRYFGEAEAPAPSRRLQAVRRVARVPGSDMTSSGGF